MLLLKLLLLLMSADKYPSIFSRQMEDILYIERGLLKEIILFSVSEMLTANKPWSPDTQKKNRTSVFRNFSDRYRLITILLD